jgi:hypothetical protein
LSTLQAILQYLGTNSAKITTIASMVATGVASIVAKNYSVGAAEILQALTIALGGAVAAQIHHGIGQVPANVLEAAGHNS